MKLMLPLLSAFLDAVLSEPICHRTSATLPCNFTLSTSSENHLLVLPTVPRGVYRPFLPPLTSKSTQPALFNLNSSTLTYLSPLDIGLELKAYLVPVSSKTKSGLYHLLFSISSGILPQAVGRIEIPRWKVRDWRACEGFERGKVELVVEGVESADVDVDLGGGGWEVCFRSEEGGQVEEVFVRRGGKGGGVGDGDGCRSGVLEVEMDCKVDARV